MPPEPNEPRPPHLRGLDPAKLLGVFGTLESGPPEIPGWQISGIAGQGGFGIVWRAERESDGLPAALKIAPGSDPDTVERIEQEAAVLATLRHPHIVGLLESGPLASTDPDLDGGLYLAMDFVDGPTLAQVIPPGGLDPPRAFALFRGIASAVAYAHDAGILHRDLKPSNILLARPDHPMVADFGLARPVHQRVQQLTFTQAGLIAGTAEYLPPEAYHRGYEPHRGADIFALGVILYEMLTGTPPRGAWIQASQQGPIDIRIDGLIRRALHPDPARRWSSVGEMTAALDDIVASPPRHAGAPLVTYPVRVADFFWTVLGLFILLAVSSTLIRLTKAQVEWPLNLIGSHGFLTGGFQALSFLLLASVPLAVWQLIRLWRFRCVPLREALPAPFGLRLGHNRTAAGLVAAAQFFCLLLPASHLVSLHVITNRIWLQPDDPPWAYGLVVTAREKSVIHSPWQTGKPDTFYWLRESYGPPAHPLSRQVDRIDFFPRTTPAVMIGTASLLGIAIVVTLGTATFQWWGRHRRRRAVVLLAGAALLTAGGAKLQALDRRLAAVERHPRRDDAWVDGVVTRHVLHFARQLTDTDAILSDSRLALYAESVSYRGKGRISRDVIPSLLAAEAAARAEFRREVSRLNDAQEWRRASGRFQVRRRVIEMLDPIDPGGPASAALLTLTLRGVIDPAGPTAIRKETVERTPLYTAAAGRLDESEATIWATAFLAAIDQGLSLDSFIHAIQLPPDKFRPGGPELDFQKTRAELLATLRAHPAPVAAGPVEILGRQPGGRTRIVLSLLNPAGGEPHRWTADLVHADGRWQCVRLAFGR